MYITFKLPEDEGVLLQTSFDDLVTIIKLYKLKPAGKTRIQLASMVYNEEYKARHGKYDKYPIDFSFVNVESLCADYPTVEEIKQRANFLAVFVAENDDFIMIAKKILEIYFHSNDVCHFRHLTKPSIQQTPTAILKTFVLLIFSIDSRKMTRTQLENYFANN